MSTSAYWHAQASGARRTGRGSGVTSASPARLDRGGVLDRSLIRGGGRPRLGGCNCLGPGVPGHLFCQCRGCPPGSRGDRISLAAARVVQGADRGALRGYVAEGARPRGGDDPATATAGKGLTITSSRRDRARARRADGKRAADDDFRIEGVEQNRKGARPGASDFIPDCAASASSARASAASPAPGRAASPTRRKPFAASRRFRCLHTAPNEPALRTQTDRGRERMWPTSQRGRSCRDTDRR
jgi:hypothetical protein